jgi:hypothetical protein
MALVTAGESPAERAGARSNRASPEGTRSRPSDKTASPERDLGRCHLVGSCAGVLVAQIVQQRIDALMIALNRCVWAVQLEKARQNLQRQHD